jgi:hypothetical protein
MFDRFVATSPFPRFEPIAEPTKYFSVEVKFAGKFYFEAETSTMPRYCYRAKRAEQSLQADIFPQKLWNTSKVSIPQQSCTDET